MKDDKKMSKRKLIKELEELSKSIDQLEKSLNNPEISDFIKDGYRKHLEELKQRFKKLKERRNRISRKTYTAYEDLFNDEYPTNSLIDEEQAMYDFEDFDGTKIM